LKDEWTTNALASRIKDAGKRQRFEAGSPNETEIAAYALDLPGTFSMKAAVILGMTPELRLLAANRFHRVICIDRSCGAIELYRDWVRKEDGKPEEIIHADWLDLPKLLKTPVAAILADGVFGNLLTVDEHLRLLDCVRSSLSPNGRFITRKAVIPEGFVPEENDRKNLVKQFRGGVLGEAEFGFGMRLLGHYHCCYDSKTYLLDNKKLFFECDEDLRAGRLTEHELALIRRYYFEGKNCIVPQKLWERLLAECGFEFKIHICRGRAWYQYYEVYSCVVR
jgi:hypothetical protein